MKQFKFKVIFDLIIDLGDSSSQLVSNEVSYDNSLLMKIASIFVGILLTVFNVILLIEVARGNT